MVRKIFYLLFLLTLLAVPQTVHAKNTLTAAWSANVGPLNPHAYNPNEMFAQVIAYDGLVHFNGKDIEPALAKSWEVSKDHKTYTFKINTAIKFSDGTPLTAQIIEKNFNAIMHNKDLHNWLVTVKLLQSWKALDNETFQLTLSEPYPLLLTELSLPRPFRILSPSGFVDPNKDDTTNIAKPIGTGPWVLVESKLGLYDRFEKNPYYWGNFGDFDELKIYVLPDANSRILALETGQVDILFGEGNFNLENFVRLSENPKFDALTSEARLTNMVALNSNRPLTKDINIRKAILHAVNKDVIIEYILKGKEFKADTIFNPHTKYNEQKNIYEYDLAKAKSYLEKAGFKQNGQFAEKDGQILELNLHYLGTDAKQKAIAEAIQADLLKLGIKLNLKAEEMTIFSNITKNGEFDLIFNKTWGPPYEPTSYIGSMLQPSHADYQAQSGLPNKAEIDKNIVTIFKTVDEKEFARLHYAVLNALHESAIYLPISFEPDMVLYNKEKIANFSFGPMTYEPLLHTLKLAK